MSEWQPIESAPRDGTRIALIRYDALDEEWLIWTDYWRDYLNGGEGFGMRTADRGPATHWAPLPPHPAQS